MPRVTTKQKLVLTFSLYVFLFIFLVAAVFFFSLKLLLAYQIRNQTRHEVDEVLKVYLSVSDGKLAFLANDNGELLGDELVETELSAIVLDSDLALVKGFGLFGAFDAEDAGSVKLLTATAAEVVASSSIRETTIVWRGQMVLIVAAPITHQGKNYGVILLGKTLSELQTVNTLVAPVFGVLGFVSLIGSFLIGHKMVTSLLAPLTKLEKSIEDIDLDKLDKKIYIEGNDEDEIVALINQYNRMLGRLKSMSVLQKEFISNASHELKTPLTNAISSLELYLRKHGPIGELTVIRNDLFEINSLIDQLMILSKITRSEGIPVGQSDLWEVTKSVVESFSPELDAKKVRLGVNVDRKVKVDVPQDYMRVILSNIVSNAIKYSSVDSRIEIGTQVTGGKIDITITDKGIGIEKEELEKVFDRFYRSPGARNYKKGHGVGLSVVKRICDLYGILVKIESEKGIGTTVRLTFP